MQAERLLAAKKEVEAKFKYSLIAETLEERIGQRYSAILYLYEELLLQAKEKIEDMFEIETAGPMAETLEDR